MLDNKLGKTFEELAEDELNQISAGAFDSIYLVGV